MNYAMPFLLSLFIAIWMGSAPVAAALTCPKTELKTCATALSSAKKVCKDTHKTAKPACKEKRKTTLAACKEARKQYTCKRTPMGDTDKARCKQVEEVATQRCPNPQATTSRCGMDFVTCQRDCFRNCKVCTPAGIQPCVEACVKARDLCQIKESEESIRCKRAAAQNGRHCKREYTLRQWKLYFGCSYNRLAADLQCQDKAYDGERDCYYDISDQYRQCLFTATGQYKQCKEAIPLKCVKR